MKSPASNLQYVFSPKSVCIVGASHEPSKIGHAILRNFLQAGFKGQIYPVNPHSSEILGMRCYASVQDVPSPFECAIIAIPAEAAVQALLECAKKGAKAAVVISGGFSEVGNKKLEEKLVQTAKKYSIALIGPNCMGSLCISSQTDSVFLPTYKLGRPKKGEIAFISQSGAIGGCILDLASRYGIGISKFVSFGNASVIDESDLLQYLAGDEETKTIVLYLEGVKDGKKFLQIASEITPQKPIIALKAGVSASGTVAVASHTGSLAGSAAAYKAAFAQAGIIEAHTLDDLFDLPKIFMLPRTNGKRIAVLTNGGGNGVLAADAIEYHNLQLASLSSQTTSALKSFLPTYANAKNPLDIIGDADAARYEKSLQLLLADKNVDAVLVILLFQTPALDSSVTGIIAKAAQGCAKPIVCVSTGGEYTEAQRRQLDSMGVPTYSSPSSAIRALSKLIEYCERNCP
ncbi:Acetate--CoA ligase [ADP-forming] I [Candidatus Anstonella stagnisolia]|nr:Acetate--CoA ligase [ADP-forming] I [Candidatus Anstonella stagnisolia]